MPIATATMGVKYVTLDAIELPANSMILKFQIYAIPEPKIPSASTDRTGKSRNLSSATPSIKYKGNNVIAAIDT